MKFFLIEFLFVSLFPCMSEYPSCPQLSTFNMTNFMLNRGTSFFFVKPRTKTKKSIKNNSSTLVEGGSLDKQVENFERVHKVN